MNKGQKITIGDIHQYVVEDIKYGGMGEVYKLRKCQEAPEFSPTFKNFVAAKTYQDNIFNQQYKGAFEKELNNWILLENEFIAPLLLIIENNRKIIAIMPWYDGNSSEYINTRDNITISDVKLLAISIAKALDYTNKKFGLIHRDIKPDNVLVSIYNNKRVRYYVSDWGISSINKAHYIIDKGSDISKTFIGAGTPAYMSPERMNGEDNRINGDIFSIGIIIYQVIFKKLPYGCSNVNTIKSDVITGKYFKQIVSDSDKIDSKLANILVKCVQPNADKRYLEYDDLINDISKL